LEYEGRVERQKINFDILAIIDTTRWMTRIIINDQKCFVGEIILGTVFRYERIKIVADVVCEDLLRNTGFSVSTPNNWK
jgi:hypothetical protein